MTAVGIFGAGAVGTYLGCWLSKAGYDVRLLGRRWLADAAADVRAIRHDGEIARLGPHATVVTDPDALGMLDVCFVAVKSHDTRDAARQLQPHMRPGGLVVSMQNGRNNASLLRAALGPTVRVVPGVVGFNVRIGEDMTFRETVEGRLHLPDGPPELRALGCALSLDVATHSNIGDVVDGKLLLNLNNGVSAATGLSVLELMRDADARWMFGTCMREGLRAFRAAGSHPARLAAMSPGVMSIFLRLPNAFVHPLLRFGRIDPRAVTSTLADLRKGRRTEIRQLNGEIVALGRMLGVATPVNDVVTRAVQRHERALEEGSTPTFEDAGELRRRCEDERRWVASLAH